MGQKTDNLEHITIMKNREHCIGIPQPRPENLGLSSSILIFGDDKSWKGREQVVELETHLGQTKHVGKGQGVVSCYLQGAAGS